MDFEFIASKQNKHIKDCIRLLNSRDFREKEKAFVVEGKRLCEELSKEGSPKIIKCFLQKNIYDSLQEPLMSVYNSAESKFLVSDDVMKKITNTQNPQGIVCICSLKENTLYEDDALTGKKYIVLENIMDPGNLGTIIRTSDALKIDGIILCKNTVDLYNPKVIRSSMGSIFRVKIMKNKDSLKAIDMLKQRNITTYAAVLSDDADLLSETKFDDKSAVFIGNEANGLCHETYENCDKRIIIDMKKNVESLNAATASTIFIWEMTK